MIFLLIGIFIIIVVMEIPHLIKNSRYREIGIFFFFYVLGAYMSLSQLYGWALYNPLKFLIILLAPIVLGGTK